VIEKVGFNDLFSYQIFYQFMIAKLVS